ncbi:MAG TPA: ectoine hydroxylase [Gammaproteobacteria bacterium]|nr:ectoine hydroxylase [Gammaproteobacteria bacterium]
MNANAHSDESLADLYPSRVGGEHRFLPRRDAIVYGSATEGPLDGATLARYERDGFLHLPEFLDNDDIAPARAELERLREDHAERARPDAITEPGSDALRSLFAVHFDRGAVAALCRERRLVAIARQLLGGDVYILQSRINYKPGFGGREFFWHSDFETWHAEDGLPRMRTASCSIALTANDANNGPLLLVPGSHRRFLSCAGETPEDNYKSSLKRQELGVPDEAHLGELIGQGGLAAATGPAGSATFFDCNLMHGSNSNITPRPRSNIFVVFNSVKNRLSRPFGGRDPRPEFLAHRLRAEPL